MPPYDSPSTNCNADLEYVCRVAANREAVTARLHGNTLELIEAGSASKRTIELVHIRKIRRYAGYATRDPVTGSYASEYCKLMLTRGRPVYLRNGSFMQRDGKYGETVTNQDEAYRAFVGELQRRLARINPVVPVVTGWLLASLAWWMLAPLGLGLWAFAVGGFVMDKITTALGIAVFCIPMGLLLLGAAVIQGRTYWPTRARIDETVTAPPRPQPPVVRASP